MILINNQIPPPLCLIGDPGGEAERDDLLNALLQSGLTSFIKLQSVLTFYQSLPDSLKPFVETWSFNDEASDLNVGQDLIKVYPLLYQDILDKNKYTSLFNEDIPNEKIFRKQVSSFREKAELVDIYTAIILNTPMLAYVNMRDNLKLFSQENQLRLRRYGMPILSALHHKEMVTPGNRLYSVSTYLLSNDIPLYPSFTKWLKARTTSDLHIIFIEKE